LRMKSKSLWQRLGFLADLINWQWGADVREELRAETPSHSAQSLAQRNICPEILVMFPIGDCL
jgi:hypothetical protein